MGVLPLQFNEGDSAETLGLTGEEIYSITGLEGQAHIPREVTVTVEDSSESGNASREFTATVRIDTPAEESYFIHGGILPYVLRNLLGTTIRGGSGLNQPDVRPARKGNRVRRWSWKERRLPLPQRKGVGNESPRLSRAGEEVLGRRSGPTDHQRD